MAEGGNSDEEWTVDAAHLVGCLPTMCEALGFTSQHCTQWAWRHTAVIPALERQRQEDQKFKGILAI